MIQKHRNIFMFLLDGIGKKNRHHMVASMKSIAQQAQKAMTDLG